MLIQAILVGLVAMCVTFEWALGTCLASRPIVTGVLIGLVMGDLETGIIVGATLEMVFIGSVTGVRDLYRSGCRGCAHARVPDRIALPHRRQRDDARGHAVLRS